MCSVIQLINVTARMVCPATRTSSRLSSPLLVYSGYILTVVIVGVKILHKLRFNFRSVFLQIQWPNLLIFGPLAISNDNLGRRCRHQTRPERAGLPRICRLASFRMSEAHGQVETDLNNENRTGTNAAS